MPDKFVRLRLARNPRTAPSQSDGAYFVKWPAAGTKPSRRPFSSSASVSRQSVKCEVNDFFFEKKYLDFTLYHVIK